MKRQRDIKPRKKQVREIVRLEDLAPRKAVKGGARRLLFGERVEQLEDDRPAASEDAGGSSE